MPHTIRALNEKPYYKYIVWQGTDLILTVPVSGASGEISLDNTCRASAQFNQFFGRQDSALEGGRELSGIESLQALKADLEADIAFLSENQGNDELLEEKQEKLVQVEQHIETLTAIQKDHSFMGSLGMMRELSTGLKSLLSEATNAYSVHIGVANPDPWTRFKPYTCNFRGTFDSHLRSSLHSLTAGAAHTINGPALLKNRVANETIEALGADFKVTDEASFETVRATLLAQIKHHIPGLDATVDLKQQSSGGNSVDINTGYIVNLLAADNLEDLELEEIVECIRDGALDGRFWELNEPLNVFYDGDVVRDADKLSIATQLFIAFANIYAKEQGIVNGNTDFAQVIESNSSLRNKLHQALENAMRGGESVEQAIIDTMNDAESGIWVFKHSSFWLRRPFTPNDLAAIRQRFEHAFAMVKKTDHHDEHLILSDSARGDFIHAYGNIAVPFSKFVQHQFSGLYSDFYRRKNRLFDSYSLHKKYGNKLPNISDSTIKTRMSLDEEDIIKFLDTATPSAFAELLNSDLDVGTKLFNKLHEDTVQVIMVHQKWRAIREAFFKIDRKNISMFDKKFDRTKLSMDIILDEDYIAALQREAISLGNPANEEGESLELEDVKTLLDSCDIEYNSVEPVENNDFKVNLSYDASVELDKCVASYFDKYDMEQGLLNKILKLALTDTYGSGSTELATFESSRSEHDKTHYAMTALDFEGIKKLQYGGDDQLNSIMELNGAPDSNQWRLPYLWGNSDKHTTRLRLNNANRDRLNDLEGTYVHKMKSDLIIKITSLSSHAGLSSDDSNANASIWSLGLVRNTPSTEARVEAALLALGFEASCEPTSGGINVICNEATWKEINALKTFDASLAHKDDNDDFFGRENIHILSTDKIKNILLASQAFLSESGAEIDVADEMTDPENALLSALLTMGIDVVMTQPVYEGSSLVKVICDANAWSRICNLLGSVNSNTSDSSFSAGQNDNYNDFFQDKIEIVKPEIQHTATENEKSKPAATQTGPTPKKQNFIARFFSSIYYFFYELFTRRKHLALTHVRQEGLDNEGDSLKDKIKHRIGSLFKKDFNSEDDDALCPSITELKNDRITVTFKDKFAALKNNSHIKRGQDLAYSLRRDTSISEVETTSDNDYSFYRVTVEGRSNVKEFLKTVFDCDKQEAKEMRNSL